MRDAREGAKYHCRRSEGKRISRPIPYLPSKEAAYAEIIQSMPTTGAKTDNYFRKQTKERFHSSSQLEGKMEDRQDTIKMTAWLVVTALCLVQISSGCSSVCKFRSRNGKCDSACNIADCMFDGGECLTNCPAACPITSIGNGECNLACNVEECLFDLEDCKGLCAQGCLPTMLGNGRCEEACNSQDCGYDAGECGCTPSLLANGVCDPPCQSAAFLFDAQDCAEFIYVNSSSPAPLGTGTRSDPYRSWSLALRHPFRSTWAGICFLQGEHLLEQSGPAKSWFDVNVTHLFLTCRFCPDCGASATLLLVDGVQVFLQANLTAALVENLQVSGLQRLKRGCIEQACAFCDAWVCKSSLCTNTRNKTVPLAAVPAACLGVSCYKPDTALLLLNHTAEMVLRNLAFAFIGNVSSVLVAGSASLLVENISVTEVELEAYAVQLSGLESENTVHITSSSLGTGRASVSKIVQQMNVTLTNVSVQNVNTQRTVRSSSCLGQQGEAGALRISTFHNAVVSDVRVKNLFNFAAPSNNYSAAVCVEAVERAVVRDCQLSLVQTKGGGLVFSFLPLLMLRPQIRNIDVANVLVEDSLFVRSGAFQISSPELNPIALVENITVRRNTGQAFVFAQQISAPECTSFRVAGLFAKLEPRYSVVRSVNVTESSILSAPSFQLLDLCNSQVTDVNLERNGVEISAALVTVLDSIGLELDKNFQVGDYRLLQNYTTDIVGVERALNLSLADFVLRDSRSAGSLAVCRNSSQVLVQSTDFLNNSAQASGLQLSDASGVLTALLFTENLVQFGTVSAFRSNFSLLHSHFLSNRADNAAGVLLDSAAAVLSDVIFESGQALSGAALVLSTSRSPVSVRLEASAFRRNTAAQGRDLLLADGQGLGVQIQALNCSFEGGNAASLLWIQHGSRLLVAHLQSLSFKDAFATDFQGLFRLQFSYGELVLEHCHWLACSNSDTSLGSIIYVDTPPAATVSFQSCAFEGNTAAFLISLPNEYQSQTLQVLDSRFIANKAQLFDLINALVQVQNTLFQGNSHKGAVLARALFGSTLQMTDCLIRDNGPAEELLISGERSGVMLANCTFSGNSASWALLTASNSRLQLESTEFLHNLVLQGSILQLQTSTLLVHGLHLQTNSSAADLLMCNASLVSVSTQQSAGLSFRESLVELEDVWVQDCLGPCLQTTKTALVVRKFTAVGLERVFSLSSSSITASDIRVGRSQSWLQLQSSEAHLQRVLVEELAGPAWVKDSKVTMRDSVCQKSNGCFAGQNATLSLEAVSMKGNSASAIELTDSDFLSQHVVWSGNKAVQGAGLHLTCPCNCCTYQLSDCMFEYNEAVRGAAVFYADIRPELRNVSLQDNKAQYGSELGTVAERLVNMSVWPEGVSGQELTLPRFQLLDEMGQVMTADNESGLVLSVPADTILQGGFRAIAEKGVFSFNGVRITTRPNSTVQITASASRVPAVLFEVHFRACAAGEVQEPDQSCFRCEPMTYSLSPTDTNCEQCPEGAVCYGGAEVFPLPGYWRSSNLSSTFYTCGRACLGSPARTHPTGECEEGYWSNLCGACTADYFRFAGTSCRLCPNTSVNVVLSLLLCVVYFCFLAKIVAGSISRAEKSETSLHLKLLLNYLQVTMLLGEFSLQWPDLLLQVFYTSSVAGSSSQSLLALDCFISDVYIKHAVVSTTPLVQIALSCLLWSVVALVRGHWRYVHDHNLSTIISLLLLMHSSLTSSVLSLFACRSLDTGNWLQEDLSLHCWQGRHLFFVLALGLPSLVIWVLGFPLAFVSLLVGAARETPVSKMRYGFLYSGYKVHFFFWEALVILRKVAVKAVSVVLSHSEPMQRVMAANTVIVSMLALQLNYQPYESARINRIETLSMVANFLTLTLGAFFNGQNSAVVRNLLFASILGANCAFLIYWVRSLVLTSTLCRRFRRKRVQAQTTDLDQSISPCKPPREIECTRIP